jgi:hypothetical protein
MIKTITLNYENKEFKKLAKEKEKSGLTWERYFMQRIFFEEIHREGKNGKHRADTHRKANKQF